MRPLVTPTPPRYECELPAETRLEMLQRITRTRPRVAQLQREGPSWLRAGLGFMAIIGAPIIVAATIEGLMYASGWHPSARPIPTGTNQEPANQPIIEPAKPLQQPASQSPRLVWECVRSEAYEHGPAREDQSRG